jgi:hypothetical protein
MFTWNVIQNQQSNLSSEILLEESKRVLSPRRVTGGEVEDPISGCLLHHLFEGRGAGLFWRFSS